MNTSHARTHVAALSVLALTLSVGGAAFAADATPGPLELVKSSVSRAFEVVQTSPSGSERRRAGIVRVSHDLFDFNEIARRALGRHWNGLSPREQQEFVLLFTEVLEGAFTASVDGYTDEKVEFIGQSTDGGLAEVRSRIIPKSGAAVSVDYRLHEGKSRWTVYDVISDHVSLVASYRGELDSLVRTSSFAALLERVRSHRLPHGAWATHKPVVSDPVAAGVFLAILKTHARSR
jgi:phospholipid transport system substrate-binding protein